MIYKQWLIEALFPVAKYIKILSALSQYFCNLFGVFESEWEKFASKFWSYALQMDIGDLNRKKSNIILL